MISAAGVQQGDFILAGQMPDLLKVDLTYLVLYCVATYGAVTAKRAGPTAGHDFGDNRVPGGDKWFGSA